METVENKGGIVASDLGLGLMATAPALYYKIWRPACIGKMGFVKKAETIAQRKGAVSVFLNLIQPRLGAEEKIKKTLEFFRNL
ncbi:hypothetical protein LI177_12785 [bacterium 210820-DFI.6.37]|nr:hypothetical protein [bacterium 210820-DFI.6.37]